MPRNPSTPAFNPRRILVRGVNWVGDAVMTTPALLRLREHFPDALIALVTREKLRGLWLNHPAIDEVIGIKQDENAWQVARKVRVVMWPDAAARRDASLYGKTSMGAPQLARRSGFDLALVLPNSPRSALETWLARIPRRVGYARPWRRFLLTHSVPSRPDAVEMHKRSVDEIEKLVAGKAQQSDLNPPIPAWAHQVNDYLNLVATLGANPEPLPPQIVVAPGEVKAVAQKFHLSAEVANNRTIFGLNPGAEYGPAKRWPADRFIAAAREIQKRTNCLWLVLGGRSDAVLAKEIEAGIGASPSAVRSLAGQTSLRELCAVLKLCRVLLTNDTGPMHIAAALGTPVVVPFGSTSPELTGPISTGGVRHQLLRANVPCAPCFLPECPIDFRCMNGITIESVVEAVLKAAQG